MVGEGQVITKIESTGGSKLGFLSIFKYSILTIIFGIMIMNAIIISIEANSIEPGFKYLGNKFLTVTSDLQQHSQIIIQQQGMWVMDNGFFLNLWNILKYFWNIIGDILIIYAWLQVLSWIAKKLILQDDSKSTAAFMIAIILFFMLQIIFILAFTDGSIMMPFNAFVDFFKSMPYIIKPITKIVETI